MDPLKPSASLLAKLGSLVVHADEAQGSNAHFFDMIAFRQLLDVEVNGWLKEMRSLGLLPEKR